MTAYEFDIVAWANEQARLLWPREWGSGRSGAERPATPGADAGRVSPAA